MPERSLKRPPIVVVMGVTGVGKSTLGRDLATHQGFRFFDADDFHPEANVAKMRAGVPLTDEDRKPWLERLAALLAQASEPTVLACSALKASYRETLRRAAPGLLVVHLTGSREAITARVAARPDHYMPSSLVESQFATLEAPAPGPYVLALDCDLPVDVMSKAVMERLAVLE
jgi:gluconokinase